MEVFRKTYKKRFIAIHLGLPNHANCLIYDNVTKRLERFEPNGKNYPKGLNYNPTKLDLFLSTIFAHSKADLPVVITSSTISTFEF